MRKEITVCFSLFLLGEGNGENYESYAYVTSNYGTHRPISTTVEHSITEIHQKGGIWIAWTCGAGGMGLTKPLN